MSTGVKQEAAKHPGIKIVDTFYHLETPQDAAAEVIRVQNAYPEIHGLGHDRRLAAVHPDAALGPGSRSKVKIVAVDALPAELAYVEKGLAPVLLAQPTYNWGYVSVQRIVDKVHLKKDVPQIIPMELVQRHEGESRQLGASAEDVGLYRRPEMYLKISK